jgi:hypothetical protein
MSELGTSHRHPNNPYGQGSAEFYEEEARLYGFKTVREYLECKRREAPLCPHCGTPYGFAFGTGDCGCTG